MAPSILSADFMKLGQSIEIVSRGGADLIHVDVMDGHFVPNLTLGVPFVSSMKKITKTPLDVHLMISNPQVCAKWYIEAGADIVTVHIEAFDDLASCKSILSEIREAGRRCGIALNPETNVEGVLELLPYVDTAMIMTVHPGFGGQTFIFDCLPKISAIKTRASELNLDIDIEVDGGINLQTTPAAVSAGANVLVAGNAVFSQADPAKAISQIRCAANE